MTSSTPHVLQSLLWPEPGLCTERDLYVRLGGGAALSQKHREIHFPEGGHAVFNTYSNLFNVGKWRKYCALEDLSLALEGEGLFEVTAFLIQPDRSWERLVSEVVELVPGSYHAEPVALMSLTDNRGIVYFELRALGAAARLRDACWQTDQAPLRIPELMLSITTFKREEAVARTAARFESFIERSALAGHIHLTVVDNGQSAEIAASEYVTLIRNANLGGSGGFSRGLQEARRRGATHCLFMDDDAAVHMEAVERTWMFLAYATAPATAVAGGLAHARHKWRLWENGACFDQLCRPEFGGLDLRDFSAVMGMEFASTADRSTNFYGGWWYFAFPVAEVKHDPFPFFVRGDDVSFGLNNDFVCTTLPGVLCHQDEDFYLKESPQTLYLDLRSHLAHHLVTPEIALGRRGLMRIVAWFYIRSLLSCHYETIAALTLSLGDVVTGPEFFEANADMAKRRGEIKALMYDEFWQDGTPPKPSAQRRFKRESRWARGLMKLTLNGHLFPFFRRLGAHVVLPAAERGARRPLWGASRITYVSSNGKKFYTVTHSKRRAWQVSRAYGAAAWRLWRGHDRIRADWRAGYNRLTTAEAWERLLDLPPARTAEKVATPAQ